MTTSFKYEDFNIVDAQNAIDEAAEMRLDNSSFETRVESLYVALRRKDREDEYQERSAPDDQLWVQLNSEGKAIDWQLIRDGDQLVRNIDDGLACWGQGWVFGGYLESEASKDEVAEFAAKIIKEVEILA